LQDIAFTLCYLLFGLRGYWSDYHYNNESMNFTHIIGSSSSSNSSNETTTFEGIGHLFVQTADANVPSMERSWIVHTMILPACMISPLWWRFLQTTRQSYDTEQRWPYLGNAFKYFLAAQVAMLGVYHPSLRQSSIWVGSFIIATVYQVCLYFVLFLVYAERCLPCDT
jgi:hypothetical protein